MLCIVALNYEFFQKNEKNSLQKSSVILQLLLKNDLQTHP